MMKFKKKLTWVIIFLFLYTVVSEKYELYDMSSNEEELKMETAVASLNTKAKKVELLKVAWEFIAEKENAETNNGEISTKVSLILHGYNEEKILLGTFPGEAFEIEDPKLYVLPQDAILTCEVFSHGLYNDFSITRDKENIIIKKRTPDEKNENDELDDFGFRIIKKIHYDHDFIIIKSKE